MSEKTPSHEHAGVSAGLSRRDVIKATAGVGLFAGIGGLSGLSASAHAQDGAGIAAHGGPQLNGHPIFGGPRARRSAEAFRVRVQAAQSYLQNFLGVQRTNGDEGRYADFRASYHKALPHNNLGEVDGNAYRAYLAALASGRSADLEAIPLDPASQRKQVNPQGGYKLEMAGRDSHNTFMRPAPTFAGAETAAEMGEVYWKALSRDVPFIDYDSSATIAAAVVDLNAFSATVGPKVGGQVTPGTIFRGETPGDLAGPYISQFLWKPVPFGNGQIVQRYESPAPGDDFMTDVASWLAVQRGVNPSALVKGNPRYIADARVLGEYVHQDFSYQAYLNAALILLSIPGSFDPDNPYNTSGTQAGFASLGGPDVLDLVAKAGNLALTGAWYQKWLVHRRLRPEVYAGRLHFQLTGAKDYGLPVEIGASEAVDRVFSQYGSYLLPMAFPEGSPTHPAYPAGHATIAGACCTVLKAFFDEEMEIPNPVQADASGDSLLPWNGAPLTIGGELNKLANNVALGRDWAGVHYRSDGVDGLEVGEQQAIGLLRDYSRTYNEDFDGFTLTRFDGTRVRIVDGREIVI